ncbi:MAG: glycoside hydrolase family 127 protein [Clostridia bacterium]|nr:glycoside hydrolase family 127 protein [Clostridia bacterium]
MITIPRNTDFETKGELKERVLLNAARLCADIYRPAAIFTQDKNGWPGDWEGRTLLALVSHMRSLHTEPPYLRDIILEIPKKLNEKGYLGRILPEGTFDEQQLSGHNWLIRGLMEYYLATGEESVSDVVKRIVGNLYVPLKGAYSGYPLEPELRKTEGSYSGTVVGDHGSWVLSTDIGCAFMCIDGLSQYYEIYRDERVLDLLKEMIGVFRRIDFTGSHMQTHATLSALRGIIRLFNNTGDREFFDIAENIFEVYLSFGMTENYANFNWFGHFDTWTEPCAITDSLMVATELYKITEDVKYLKLANRIYFNAFCYAQRYNGGFGTDDTVGPAGKYLKPNGAGISEAFWCCTMRGAEGLLSMCLNSALSDSSGRILIPFGGSFTIRSKEFELDFQSLIPYRGEYTITLISYADCCFTVSVFDGEKFIDHKLSARAGESIVEKGSFQISLMNEDAFTVSGKKYFFGNLLLGTPNPDVKPLYEQARFVNGLQPLTNMKDVTMENITKEKRQIVF